MRPWNNRQKQVLVCIASLLLASSTTALAQSPDNAALLYYQAFLLYEKPDATIAKMRDDYREGDIALNDALAQYLEKNRQIVDLVAKATDIVKCDWGYDYSQGVELSMPNLAHFRQIAFLLATEAKWQADQGNYQTALDRCMTMRKMAAQVCDRTLISYIVGIAVDALADRAIENVLPFVPADVDELSGFRSHLIEAGQRFPSLASNLTQEAQVCSATMYKDKVQAILKAGQDGATGAMIERLKQGDEAFFKRNRDYWFNTMAKLRDVLERKLPYTEMSARLDTLAQQLNEDMKDNPDATLTAMSLSPDGIKRIYLLTVRKQTQSNALIAAIDVYIAKARTGQLPDSLSPDSPPDLFTGKPFAYSKTAQGFILRSQDPTGKANEFEFAIEK